MWSNWSGSQTSDAPVLRPAGAEHVARVIRETSGTLRPLGAGHSFTPLVSDAGTIVAPQPGSGDVVHQVQGDLVRLDPNASLRDLSEAMAVRGRAFRNLGDINTQSLAGAVSTATHGTGRGLQCLAAQLTGASLVDAQGALVEIAPEDLPGAQVALGVLGVMVEAEIVTEPVYNLRRQAGVRPQGALIEEMHAHWERHRNYEFFLLPHSGKGMGIAHDLSDAPAGKAPMDLDELGVAWLKFSARLRHVHPALRRAAIGLLAAAMGDEDYVGESWQVLCKSRRTRFNEMEYHVPPDMAADVIGDILEVLERRHGDVWFPIEVRQTAGDGAWLSPFQGGARVSVAVHMEVGRNHEAYFRDCEAVFRAAGGRPHWGKLHSLTRADLEGLYPDLERFDRLRARMDPDGRFLSGPMATLLRP